MKIYFKMKKIIIYLLLFFSSLYSILGKEGCSQYLVTKFEACRNVHLSSSDKSCAYINDECKEQIADSSLYKGTKASECEAIIPKDNVFSKAIIVKQSK